MTSIIIGFTFRAAQIWKANGLVASLLVRTPTGSYVEPLRGCIETTMVLCRLIDRSMDRHSGPPCRPGPVCLLWTVKDCSSAEQQKTVGICLAAALIAVKQG